MTLRWTAGNSYKDESANFMSSGHVVTRGVVAVRPSRSIVALGQSIAMECLCTSAGSSLGREHQPISLYSLLIHSLDQSCCHADDIIFHIRMYQA
jgi:hypothetical protein